MLNRFLSGWRVYVLTAVVASFVLLPCTAAADRQLQTAAGDQASGGLTIGEDQEFRRERVQP